MTNNTLERDEWRNWLKSRPPSVQRLAEEFPYGESYQFIDAVLYIVGWTTDDEVLLSRANPYEDFDASRHRPVPCPAIALRDAAEIVLH